MRCVGWRGFWSCLDCVFFSFFFFCAPVIIMWKGPLQSTSSTCIARVRKSSWRAPYGTRPCISIYYSPTERMDSTPSTYAFLPSFFFLFFFHSLSVSFSPYLFVSLHFCFFFFVIYSIISYFFSSLFSLAFLILHFSGGLSPLHSISYTRAHCVCVCVYVCVCVCVSVLVNRNHPCGFPYRVQMHTCCLGC